MHTNKISSLFLSSLGHIFQSHSRQDCPHCGKSILNKHFLRKHLLNEHGIKDGLIFCDICSFFCTKNKLGFLKNHMRVKHGKKE